MDSKSNLIIAKQKAHGSKGSNFYVTKQGIKRDFNLMGAKYEYKVYFKNGLYVEDSEGVKIENPEAREAKPRTGSKSRKTPLSSELRDTPDAEVDKDVE
jgi:hypothetical protein